MIAAQDTTDIEAWFVAAHARIPGFCTRHFSLWGTIKLHRAALGLDLIRAPTNVLLAPLFLLSRIVGLILRLCRARRAADWIAAHPLVLRTAVAARVERLVLTEVLGLNDGPLPQVLRPLGDYSGTRNAMAEITTSLGTLGTGAILFKTVTPGVVTLAPAMALTWAQAAAIAAFPLGGGLGSTWYWMFPTHAPLSLMIGVGIGLSLAASVLTTFAGIVADPVQQMLGMHRRRLRRFVTTIERVQRGEPARFRAHEHLVARMGDLADLSVSMVRLFRP